MKFSIKKEILLENQSYNKDRFKNNDPTINKIKDIFKECGYELDNIDLNESNSKKSKYI